MSGRKKPSVKAKGRFNPSVTSANVSDPKEKDRNDAGFVRTPPEQAGIFRKHFSGYVQKEKEGAHKLDIIQHTKITRIAVFKILVGLALMRQLASHVVDCLSVSAFFDKNAFKDVNTRLAVVNVLPQQLYTKEFTSVDDFTELDVKAAGDMDISMILALFYCLQECACQLMARQQGKAAFVQSEGYENKNKHKGKSAHRDVVEHWSKVLENNNVAYFFKKSAIIENHNLSTLGRILRTALYPNISPKNDYTPNCAEDVDDMEFQCIEALERYFDTFMGDIKVDFNEALRAIQEKFELSGDVYFLNFDGDWTQGYLFSPHKAGLTAENEKAQSVFFEIIVSFLEHHAETRAQNILRAKEYFEGQRKFHSKEGGMTSGQGMTHYGMMCDSLLKEAGIYIGEGNAEASKQIFDSLKDKYPKLGIPDIIVTEISDSDLKGVRELVPLREIQEEIGDVVSELDEDKYTRVLKNMEEKMEDGHFEGFMDKPFYIHANVYGESVPEAKNQSDCGSDESNDEGDGEDKSPKDPSVSYREERNRLRIEVLERFGADLKLASFFPYMDLDIGKTEFDVFWTEADYKWREWLQNQRENLERDLKILREQSDSRDMLKFGFVLKQKVSLKGKSDDEQKTEKARRKTEWISELKSRDLDSPFIKFIEDSPERAKKSKAFKGVEWVKKREEIKKVKREYCKMQTKANKKRRDMAEKNRKGQSGQSGSTGDSPATVNWDELLDFDRFRKLFTDSDKFLFDHLSLRLYFEFFKVLIGIIKRNPDISEGDAHEELRIFLERSHSAFISAIRSHHASLMCVKGHFPEKVLQYLASFNTRGITGKDDKSRQFGLVYGAYNHSVIQVIFEKIISEVKCPDQAVSMLITIKEPLAKILEAFEDVGIRFTRGVICECIIHELSHLFNVGFMSKDLPVEEIPKTAILIMNNCGENFNPDLFTVSLFQHEFRNLFSFKGYVYNAYLMEMAAAVEAKVNSEQAAPSASNQDRKKKFAVQSKKSKPLSEKTQQTASDSQKKIHSWLSLALMKENARHKPYTNTACNCLFLSFKAVYDLVDSAQEMRDKVSQYVIDNDDEFKSFFFPIDKSMEDFFGSFENWIENIKNQDYFGDTAALEALVQIYKKKIIVLTKTGTRIEMGSDFEGNGLLVNNDDIHFEGGIIEDLNIPGTGKMLIMDQLNEYWQNKDSDPKSAGASGQQKADVGKENQSGHNLDDPKVREFRGCLIELLALEIKFCEPHASDKHKKVIRFANNTYYPQKQQKKDGSGLIDQRLPSIVLLETKHFHRQLKT